MSGPRFLLSGVLVLTCLTAFFVAITSTQASGSARTAPVARTTASADLGSSTDLPPWLAPAGISIMLAGIAVVGTARRRTAAIA